MMEPHIDVITLAVGDLDRSLAFYRDGLGLETAGVVATEFVDEETNAAGAIVIFRLKGGLVLALYPRSELAKDADIPVGPPKTGEFSIGQLVESRAQVDALLAKAERAGATLTGRPHDRPWGIYSGYFRDPDGHLWEIIWNPPDENTTQCPSPARPRHSRTAPSPAAARQLRNSHERPRADTLNVSARGAPT